MKIQIQIMIAYIVNFWFALVQPANQVVSEDGKIRENFQNLFNSLAKHDARKSDTYRAVLKEEVAIERQAFDEVKNELWIARNRNSRHFRGNNETISVVKRDDHESVNVLKLDPKSVEYSKEAWSYIKNGDIEKLSNTFRAFIESHRTVYKYVSREQASLLKGAFESLLVIGQTSDCKVLREEFVISCKIDFVVDYMYNNDEKRMLFELKYRRTKNDFEKDIKRLNKCVVEGLTKYLLNLDDEGIAAYYGPVSGRIPVNKEGELIIDMNKNYHEFREIILQCPYCPVKFTEQDSVNRHVSNIHPKEFAKSRAGLPVFECVQCGIKYKSERYYNDHMKKHHNTTEPTEPTTEEGTG